MSNISFRPRSLLEIFGMQFTYKVLFDKVSNIKSLIVNGGRGTGWLQRDALVNSCRRH